MKKYFVMLAMLFAANSAFSQAKKPTIMVVPNDNWCYLNGYMVSYDNQGSTKNVPDYERAFQENSDLVMVVNKISGMMAERGFPLVDMQATMDAIQTRSAINSAIESKSGSGVNESAYDKLMNTARADIKIEISWTINQIGPKRSVSFTLAGKDAYTGKTIVSLSGTGAQSFSVELPILLEEAVLNYIDNFNAGLQKHFDDLFANGREIMVYIEKFSSWDEDLESEYNGMELGEIIEEWMASNTVKGRFNTAFASEERMKFTQVRIPLYDEKGKALDARSYMRKLSNYLKNTPFSIPNKLTTQGLGEITIFLGEK